MEKSNEIEKNKDSRANNLLPIEGKFVLASSRYPLHVVNAGIKIQKTVTLIVWSSILNFISIGGLLILFIFFVMPETMLGHSNAVDDYAPGILFFGLLAIAGFILWIISNVRLNQAGNLLKKSESLFYRRKAIKFIPDLSIKEFSGIKVGHEFGDGIVVAFDKLGKYILVCSKDNINNLKDWSKADEICNYYNSGGQNDWFLPDVDEVKIIRNVLHLNNIGGFTQHEYLCRNRFTLNFSNGQVSYYNKGDFNIRPVRIVVL